jgi:hypothetical protein
MARHSCPTLEVRTVATPPLLAFGDARGGSRVVDAHVTWCEANPNQSPPHGQFRCAARPTRIATCAAHPSELRPESYPTRLSLPPRPSDAAQSFPLLVANQTILAYPRAGGENARSTFKPAHSWRPLSWREDCWKLFGGRRPGETRVYAIQLDSH